MPAGPNQGVQERAAGAFFLAATRGATGSASQAAGAAAGTGTGTCTTIGAGGM